MKILNYSFGKININNNIYKKDLLLVNDMIFDNWYRKKGHELCLDDLSQLIDYQLEVIYIGTGKFGMMKVPEELIKTLNKKGVPQIIIKKSDEIVKLFNNSQSAKKALAIHLTC